MKKETEVEHKAEVKEVSKSPVKTKDSSNGHAALKTSSSSVSNSASNLDFSDGESAEQAKESAEKENSNSQSNSQSLSESDNSIQAKARKSKEFMKYVIISTGNRFAKDKPTKSDSLGLSLFESLSKSQKAANGTSTTFFLIEKKPMERREN